MAQAPRDENQPVYWIGVNSTPLGEALRSHLKLAKGEGLLVLDVVPKSPARNAGLKRYDVLLTFGKSSVGTPAELTRAIQQAGAKPVKLQIIRAGERKTATVTPGERSRNERGIRQFLASRPHAEGKLSNELLDLLQKHGLDRKQAVRVWMLGPGVEMAHGAPTQHGFQAMNVQPNGNAPNGEIAIDGRIFRATPGVWTQRWVDGPWGGFQWQDCAGIVVSPLGIHVLQVRGHHAGGREQQLKDISRKLDLLQQTVQRLKAGRKQQGPPE